VVPMKTVVEELIDFIVDLGLSLEEVKEIIENLER
jgi:hypothetical protein